MIVVTRAEVSSYFKSEWNSDILIDLNKVFEELITNT